MNNILLIFLSGLLYNLAFFFPDLLGFLVLFFWIPLYIAFPAKRNFALGVGYGFFMYAPHCIWLLVLLLTKSEASVPLSVLLYLCIVFYFSLTAGLWLSVYGFLARTFTRGHLFLFWVTLVGYFVLLNKYSLWFVGGLKRGEAGYPFFSPFVPLASYKSFLSVLGMLMAVFKSVPEKDWLQRTDYKIVHLKPDTQAGYRSSPEVVGQRIYHKLAALKLHELADEYKYLIVVAPESTFPFALNKYPELPPLWSYVIPRNAHFLIGAYKDEGRMLQSVYWIKEGRIIKTYDKQHLIPFVEKHTLFWRSFQWSNSLFLHNKRRFHRVHRDLNFELASDFEIKPLICSELFFCDVSSNFPVFCFINDSWFIKPFVRWMQLYSRFKAVMLQVPVVYIGFEVID